MIVLLILSLFFGVGSFEKDLHSNYWKDEKAFSDLLKSDEQIHLTRPIEFDANGKAQPVIVKVNVYLRAISHVSDENMEYQLQFTFREEWRDPRLAWGNSTKGSGGAPFVVVNQEQKIWKPDTFFQNEKSGHRHEIDEPNVLLRVHRDGHVLYSVRLTMTFSCLMDFHYYPMDVQHCGFQFASYAYTADDIYYQFKDTNPIQIKSGFRDSLPQFDFTNYSNDSCTSKTWSGTYSCRQIWLVLSRRFDFFLLHLYLPSAALVIISWISFWLHPSNVPGRITLGLIVLLSSHVLSSGLNEILPPVAYLKAIDVWVFACIIFILASLIEFAIVAYLFTAQLAKNNNTNSIELQQLLFEDDGETLGREVNNTPRRLPIYGQIRSAVEKDVRIIDRVSRILFPFVFCLFNIFYWLKYINDK